MSTTNIVLIVLGIILIILFILALWWEVNDYIRLQNRTPVSEIDEEDQSKELKFYGCYNYQNAIYWRGTFIGAFLGAIISSLLLELTDYKWMSTKKYYVPFVIFVGVFVIFHILMTFKDYHLFRIMCSKIDDDMEIV